MMKMEDTQSASGSQNPLFQYQNLEAAGEEISFATTATTDKNNECNRDGYGIVEHHKRNAFVSKYKTRGKMLLGVIASVLIFSGSALYLKGINSSEEVTIGHPSLGNEKASLTGLKPEASIDEDFVILKSKPSNKDSKPMAQPLQQSPETIQVANTSPVPRQVSFNSGSPPPTSTTQSNLQPSASISVPVPDIVQKIEKPPLFNPKARCTTEKLDPKKLSDMDGGVIPNKSSLQHPRSLLLSMRECPTFVIFECKKHVDRVKPLSVGFKAVLNVRSSMNEFMGYGISKKVAIKNAADRAVSELYADRTRVFKEDEIAVERKLEDSVCTEITGSR